MLRNNSSTYSVIDKHFSQLNQVHNLKVRHCCTTNTANVMKNHNHKIPNECNEVGSREKCNYRNNNFCSLDGKCHTSKVIYEATCTVTTISSNTKTCAGMTENDLKTRHNNQPL